MGTGEPRFERMIRIRGPGEAMLHERIVLAHLVGSHPMRPVTAIHQHRMTDRGSQYGTARCDLDVVCDRYMGRQMFEYSAHFKATARAIVAQDLLMALRDRLSFSSLDEVMITLAP